MSSYGGIGGKKMLRIILLRLSLGKKLMFENKSACIFCFVVKKTEWFCNLMLNTIYHAYCNIEFFRSLFSDGVSLAKYNVSIIVFIGQQGIKMI